MDNSLEQRVKELEEENRMLREGLANVTKADDDEEINFSLPDKDILLNVADNIDYVIVLWSPAFKVLFTSNTFEKLYGISAGEFKKHPFTFLKLIHPGDRFRFLKLTSLRMLNRPMEDAEVRIVVNNEVKWVLIKEKRIVDKKGKHILTVGISSDITKFRNNLEELERYKNNLEEQVAARTREYQQLNEEYESLNEEMRSNNDQLVRANNNLKHEIENRILLQRLLENSEAKYRNFFQKSFEGIMLINKEGRIIEWNSVMIQIFGLKPEEVIGMYHWDFEISIMPVERRTEEFKNKLRDIHLDCIRNFDKQIPITREGTVVTKNGEKYVRFTAFPVVTDNDAYIGHITWDITEQRKGEQELVLYRTHLEKVVEERTQALVKSEEQFGQIVRQLGDIVSLVDAKGTITYISPMVEKILGYRQDELINKRFYDLIYPDDLKFASGRFGSFIAESKKDAVIDIRVKHKDGSLRHIEIVSNNQLHNTMIQSVVVTLRDITERLADQNKLKENKIFIESINNTIPGFIFMLDIIDRKMIFINESFYKTLGYTHEDVQSFRNKGFPVSLFHPDDKDKVFKSMAAYAVIKENEVFENEYRLKTKKGEYRFFHDWTRLFSRTDDGKVKQVISISQDITDQKKAEEKILENQERFRSIFENAPEGVTLTGTDSRFLDVNPSFCRMLGYKREEITGMHFNVITHPDDIDISGMWMQKLRSCEINSTSFEKRYLHKDGHIIWIIVSTSLYRDINGTSRYCIAHFTDITEKKKSEELLKESEERFRTTFDDAPNGMCLLGLNGILVMANHSFCKMMGYKEEELITTHFDKITHPDDIEKSNNWVRKMLSGDAASSHFEIRFIHRENRTIWVAVSITLYKDSSGLPKYFITHLVDITERIQTEAVLKNSFSLLESTLESTDNGILVIGPDRTIIKANARFAEMWRIPEEIIATRDDDKMINYILDQLTDPEAFIKKVMELYSSPRAESYDFLSFKDGRVFERLSKPMYVAGEPKGRVWSFRDITVRKNAEDALKISEEKYRKLIETTNTGFVMIDENGCVMDANNEYIRLTGYNNLSEISGRQVSEWTAPHDLERNKKEVALCMERGFVRNLEIDYITPAGNVNPIEINASVINMGGRDVILTICRDITERRKTGETLRQSEERFRIIFEQSTMGIAMMTKDFRFFRVNRSFTRMLEYTESEMMDKTFKDITHPDHLKADTDNVMMLVKGEIPYYYTEKRYVSKTGKIIWAAINLSIMREMNSSYCLAMIEDISDRKKANEALSNSESRFRHTAEQTGQLIYDYDISSGNIYWAGAITRLTGYSSEEFMNVNIEQWEDMIHPDDRYTAVNMLNEAMKQGNQYYVEYRFRTRDRNYIYMEDNGTFLKNDKGESYRMLGSMRDISDRKKAEEALCESETRFRKIVEQAPIAMAIISIDGVIEYINQKSIKVFGFMPEDIPNMDRWWVLAYPDEEYRREVVANWTGRVRKALAEGREIEGDEFRTTCKDGTIKIMFISGVPVAGKIFVLFDDITERKRVQERIRQSESRLRKAQEVSKTGSWELDVKTEKLSASDEAYRLFGFNPADSILSMDSIIQGVSPEEIARLKKSYYVFLSEQRKFDEDFQYYNPVEKKSIYMNVKAEMVLDDQQKPVRLLGTVQDLTEKKEMENRIFSAIIETEEKERQRVAQDLHDEVGPLLSSLNLYMSSFAEKIPGDEKIQFVFTKMKEIVKDAVQNVRDLSYALSPNLVINFGLHRAVLNTINRNADLIDISFNSNIENIRLETNQEIVYYRILKELINNTLKHASAKNISIRLFYNDGILNFEYKDDGVGTTIDMGNPKKEGLGLNNILSRIKLINGLYTFDSNPGKGFTFTLSTKIELKR